MESSSPPEEEPMGILCPACLQSNRPLADFCERCGAPLSAIAVIDPLKSTFSEGFAYRRAVDGPPSRLVLIGIWVIFLPSLLVLPNLFHVRGADLPSQLFSVAYLGLSAVILFRATANYLRKRLANPAEANEDV